MLIAFALVLALPSWPVDVAGPTPDALRAIDRTWSCSEVFNRSTLLIRSARPESLKIAIGLATTGTWTWDASGPRLTRSSEQVKAIQKREDQRIRAAFEAKIGSGNASRSPAADELVHDLGQALDRIRNKADWKVAEAALSRVTRQMPLARVKDVVLRRIGIGPLMKVLPGERTVYSSMPGQFEQPMPDVSDLIKQCNAELGPLREAAQKSGIAGDDFIRGNYRALSGERQGSRIVCAFSRHRMTGDNCAIQMYLVSEDGRVVDMVEDGFNFDYKPEIPNELDEDVRSVKLEPSSLEAISRIRNLSYNKAKGGETKRPANREPLTDFVEDILEKIAIAEHFDLIAFAPDDLYAVAYEIDPRGKLTVQSLARALAKTDAIDMRIEDAQLLVSPHIESLSRYTYVDRKSLDRLEMATRGREPSLREWARFHTENPALEAFQSLVLAGISSTGEPFDIASQHANWLRFFDVAAPNLKPGHGVEVKASQLPDPQRAVLLHAILTPRFGYGPRGVFRSIEPCEALDTAADVRLIWTCESSQKLQYWPLDGKPPFLAPLGDVRQLLSDPKAVLAEMFEPAQKSIIQNGAFAAVALKGDDFMDLSVEVGPDFRTSIRFTLNHSDGVKVKRYEELPEEIRKAIGIK